MLLNVLELLVYCDSVCVRITLIERTQKKEVTVAKRIIEIHECNGLEQKNKKVQAVHCQSWWGDAFSELYYGVLLLVQWKSKYKLGLVEIAEPHRV